MDWQSVIFGAFLGIAGVFGAIALALYPVMRRTFLLWIAARTLAFFIMAIALFPVALPVSSTGDAWRIGLGGVAVAMGAASAGPLLAAYLEQNLPLQWVRKWLRAMFIVGSVSAVFTIFGGAMPLLDLFYDVGLLVVTLVVFWALAKAVKAGSRVARFQAVAWGPLIAVGFASLSFELLTGDEMPFWTVAVLAALAVDIIVTAMGLVDGFMLMQEERDKAVAGINAAHIAVATDPLTGIANRRGLEKRFADPAHGRPAALALIDCDKFKQINDGFGHAVGDEVLVCVADALGDLEVFPARLGGEEFVILLYGENWEEMAETVRARITSAVAHVVPEVSFPVTASAGVAPVFPGEALRAVLQRADRAMYAAKDAGRNCSVVAGSTSDAEDRKPESNVVRLGLA
ncbi:GGDEF domain-containing protein [Qipengyuania marisflavi]|uniref:diguanylate cyclase n=1 Tax=Qipengyuania marisflavi TaxID=2486356 RepID=A0A5S3P0L9_9SPHN|nr:GGDEF domain-containing protein [Qipengyuania marisflavi]TMM46201.1 diguanylate cyclase [Qipengyuania marisflavi]